MTAARRRSTRGLLAWGVGSGLLAWIVLRHATPAAMPHHDVIRDWLLARQCRVGAGCPTFGAATSLGGVSQGTGWISVLVLLQRLGLDPDGASAAIQLTQASAVGLLAGWARRRSAAAALGTALGGLLVLRYLLPTGSLWNPALAPLPMAVAVVAALWVSGSEGRPAPLSLVGGLLAGLGLCGGLEGHPAVAVLAVPLVAALLAGEPISAGSGFCVGGAMGLAASWEAWATSAASLGAALVELGAAGGLLLAMILAAGLRRAKPRRRPLGALAMLLVVPWIQLAVARHLLGAPNAPRYELALFAPGSLVLGLGADVFARACLLPLTVSWGRARIGLVGVAVLMGLGIRMHPERLNEENDLRPAGGWSLGELRAVGDGLQGRWPGAAELLDGLRGPGCRGQLAGLAMEMPDRPPDQGWGGGRLMRGRSEAAWATGTLPDGAAWSLTDEPSWVRRTGELCAGAGGVLRCEALGSARYVSPRSLDLRAYPTVLAGAPITAVDEAEWRLDLRVEAGVRTLRVVPQKYGSRWEIGAVEGVPFQGALPASTVRLVPTEAAEGALRLVRVRAPGEPPSPPLDFPPCLEELPSAP